MYSQLPFAYTPAVLGHQERCPYGTIVGCVTSGAFSAAQGSAVGLCLIAPPTETSGVEALEKGDYSVPVEGRIIPAILQRKAFAR